MKEKLKKIVYMVASACVITITIGSPVILINTLPYDFLNKPLNPDVGFLIFIGWIILGFGGLSLADYLDSQIDKM